MPTMNVSLPAELAEFVEREVAGGERRHCQRGFHGTGYVRCVATGRSAKRNSPCCDARPDRVDRARADGSRSGQRLEIAAAARGGRTACVSGPDDRCPGHQFTDVADEDVECILRHTGNGSSGVREISTRR